VVSRAQKSKFGCLVQVVLLAAVAYYGFDWGMVYYRFWSLEQEMHSQADLAAGIDDGTIRRRLVLRITALRLPDQAKSNIQIRRRSRPREITISTSYVAQLKIPFRPPLERTLNPTARQALGSF
jgi:hypothetical protein